MTRKQLITSVARCAVVLLFGGAFFSRCANIMTPDGGPKDTLPPYIVKMVPDNFTTNFKGKKIYIEFNEFVQIKDQNKEMYTSPAMKKAPLVTMRGKGIVITLRDTLKENTTYAIDLGSAIQDNNESNPLNAMRYVFSTGDKIDSLMCSGYTADSYKADSVSRTFIWFYIADSLPNTPQYDSTIFLRKPDVIARAQNNGIFIAQNLKPVNYRIYAFGDKNDNQLYEAGSDMVGLLDTTYNPATMPPFGIWFDSLRMYPSAEPQLYFRMFTDVAFKNQRLVASTRPECKKAVLHFNTAHPIIERIRFDSIPDDKILYDPRTVGKDTVNLWFNMPAEQLPDTLKGEITYMRHDSTRTLAMTTEPLKLAWKLIETKEEEKEREKEEKERAKAEKEGREYTPPKKPNPFKLTLSAQKEVNPEKGFTMSFGSPAVAFDTASIQLVRYNDKNEPTTVNRHFVRDTMDMCRWEVRAKWENNSKYMMYVPTGAVTDIMGYKNDSLKMEFTTYDPEKFATIVLNVKTSPRGRRSYIVLLTDANGKTLQEIKGVRSGRYRFNFVPAGEVRLRVIEDMNDNGKWDAGNVVERLQPERAESYISERGEDLFATKMNWEIEINMDMDKVFQPMTMENLVRILDEKEKSRLEKLLQDMKEKAQKEQEKQHNHNQQSSGNSMGGFGSAMGGLKQATGLGGR